MNATITSFTAYPDASGFPALVDVSHGQQRATFALDCLGNVEAPSCNLVASGLSARMTAKAADAARRLYTSHVKGSQSAEWLRQNSEMYTE